MSRQVLLDLTFGSIPCQCSFLTDLSKWFQAYNLHNTGIFGIIFSQATLTTAFWHHEVTKWHLRRKATHGHAVHEVQVSLQDSIKYYVFKFLVFIRVVTVNNSRRINQMETNFQWVLWCSILLVCDGKSIFRGQTWDLATLPVRVEVDYKSWGMTIESILINAPWHFRRQRNTLCFAPTSKTCIKNMYTYIYIYTRSSFYAISFARTLIFIVITSTVWLWDLILIMQPSMTLVMAIVRFWNCTHLNGYHFTADVPGCDFALACSNVRESMCYCRWRLIVDSRRQARNYKQWAGVWSILEILLPHANSNTFAFDGSVWCRLLLTYSG